MDFEAVENVRQKILSRKKLDSRSTAIAEKLHALAVALTPLPDNELTEYLDEIKKKLVPTEEQELQAARARLKKRFDQLETKLRAYSDGEKGWKTYLLWKETEQILSSHAPLPDTLRKLETRWTAAPLAWDLPLLRECGAEVQALVALLRRNSEMVNCLAESLAAKKSALGKPLNAAEIIPYLPFLNSLAQIDLASRLTVRLRGSITRPLFLMTIQPKFFSANSAFSEDYSINDARASGKGQIRGIQSTRLVPDSSIARFEAHFSGTNTSQTSSLTQGVQISSSATSQINARKEFSFFPTGIVSLPAVATANTNLQFTGISVSGGRRYQAEARSRVSASRGQAERDTQLAVEKGLRDRLDKEGASTIANFDKSYKRDVLEPLYNQTDFQPLISTKSSNEGAHWHMTLLRPHELLILPPVPELAPTMMQTSSHQSFYDRVIEMRLSNSTLDQSNWHKVIGKRLADRISTTNDDEDAEWSIVLPERTPCEFDFSNNNIVVIKVHLKQFKNPEIEQDNIDLRFEFESQVVDGKWVLKRKNAPQVQFLTDPVTGRFEEKLSGRQLSLRSMLRRQLERLLGQEIILTPYDLGFVKHHGRELAFEAILCCDQWLVMNLK